MTVARLPLVASHPAWRAAQYAGVALTLALLIGFVTWPGASLRLLWDMVIPLLPAVFLMNPVLWRNVCPLATINEFSGRRRASPGLELPVMPAAWAVGAALLVLMVPARRFLFNEHGLVMTITVAAVAALALASGFVLSRRAGFCNSICPVLPVEKLYGQAPLVNVGSARCMDCNHCVPVGCPDLAGRKSATQSVAGSRQTNWVFTPFGLFAAAFPGFIVGYFATENGPLSIALWTYLTVSLWSLGSLALAVTGILLTRARAATSLFVLGAVSIGTYYWFAAPRLVDAYGGDPPLASTVRAAALIGIAAWAVRGWRRMGA